MKVIFVLLFLSLSLEACTSIPMSPEDQERARERRAELHMMRSMWGR